MEMETRMLKYTIDFLGQYYAKELELLKVTLPVITEIPGIPFHEAKALVAEHYKRSITDYEDFEPEEEKLLCDLIYERYGSEFVFVTKYPSAKRPFYAMDSREDTEVTERFTCKLLNLSNVRLTTLFPRDINRLLP